MHAMEAAKLAIAEFTSKRGQKTYVEENHLPAVTREVIKPTRHEIVTEAVDREVHQHHYHTTVQPISHREVLPTKHTHNLITATSRDFKHKTHDLNLKIQAAHAQEVALFTNHSVTHETHHTKSVMPVAVGEHVHHHIHEVVQPVIFKETTVPEVVHTTIPIHEVHHREPTHHQMSELATLTLADFMARHKGRESVSRETYQGAPRAYNSKLTINPLKYSSKPSPIDVSAARHSTSTPPLSPASAASSVSMPSTPKSHGSVSPDVRKSVDTTQEFDLNHSPSPKHTAKVLPQTEQMQTPQRVHV